MAAPLLSVKGLSKRFPIKVGVRSSAYVSAVDDVSFDVAAGESLGIVGESGCGKSTTARLMLGLIEPDAGEVIFDELDVRRLGGHDRKAFRRQMQMVFQDPFAALNPRMSIGENIGFPLMVHDVAVDQRRRRTAELLEQVGLHRQHASYFPHQLSGG